MKTALMSAFLVLMSAGAVSAQQTGTVPVPPPPRASAPVPPPVGQPVAEPDPTAVSVPAPPPVTTAAPAGTTASPSVTIIPGAQTSGGRASNGAVIVPARRTPGSTQVTLQIELETEQEGRISVAIYQDAESFRRGQGALRTLMVARNGAVTPAWVLGMAPGRYAIAVWQDVDGDGAQRKGALGLGGEPLGYSNNQRGRFGLPAFDLVAFDLPATGATQRIRLR